MRKLRVAAAIAAALLAAPALPALAHEGNPDYRSVVEEIDPAAPGLEIEVVNFDDSLRLVNRSGLDVVIEGYDDEPYARVLADGSVELNRNSPAYYLNDDRFGAGEVPNDVDPEDAPDWETIDRSSMLQWHDHRMHWMSTSLPPQVEDESERTKIFDYSIPIEVDGQAGALNGTLTWVGQDSGEFGILPLIAVAAGLAVAAGIAWIRRRRLDSGETTPKEAW